MLRLKNKGGVLRDVLLSSCGDYQKRIYDL